MRAIECGLPKEEAAPHLSLLASHRTNGSTQEEAAGADRALTLLGHGMLDLQAGRFLEAAERFAELVEIEADNPQAYRYLAVALQKMGREEDAIDVWRMARNLTAHE